MHGEEQVTGNIRAAQAQGTHVFTRPGARAGRLTREHGSRLYDPHRTSRRRRATRGALGAGAVHDARYGCRTRHARVDAVGRLSFATALM